MWKARGFRADSGSEGSGTRLSAALGAGARAPALPGDPGATQPSTPHGSRLADRSGFTCRLPACSTSAGENAA